MLVNGSACLRDKPSALKSIAGKPRSCSSINCSALTYQGASCSRSGRSSMASSCLRVTRGAALDRRGPGP